MVVDWASPYPPTVYGGVDVKVFGVKVKEVKRAVLNAVDQFKRRIAGINILTRESCVEQYRTLIMHVLGEDMMRYGFRG